MTEAPFTMPILRPLTSSYRRQPRECLTFVATDVDRSWSLKNHYQTLERIKERGGFSWPELAAVLEHRPFRRMPADEARAVCQHIAWERNQ